MKIRNLLPAVSPSRRVRIRVVPQWYIPRREILSPAMVVSLASQGLVQDTDGAWIPVRTVTAQEGRSGDLREGGEFDTRAKEGQLCGQISSPRDLAGEKQESHVGSQNNAPVMQVDDRLTVLDLFAGIGGFSYGLHMTGHYKTVGFVEIDKFCQKVLAKNFPGTPIFGDIRDVTTDTLSGLGRIDVITAGFPCQPFSRAGNRRASSDERFLWADIYRIIREVKPKFFLLENVPGLTDTGQKDEHGRERAKGIVFAGILHDIAALGFNAEWGIIPAIAAGASHLRERIWIVGYTSEIGRQKRDTAASFRQSGQSAWEPEKRRLQGYPESSMGRMLNGLPGWLDKYRLKSVARRGQPRNAWEPKRVLSIEEDVPDRNNRIAAVGNSIYPPIAAAIGECVYRWHVQHRRVRAFASGRTVGGEIEVSLAEGR